MDQTCSKSALERICAGSIWKLAAVKSPPKKDKGEIVLSAQAFLVSVSVYLDDLVNIHCSENWLLDAIKQPLQTTVAEK